jgi:hypothetical protein
MAKKAPKKPKTKEPKPTQKGIGGRPPSDRRKKKKS